MNKRFALFDMDGTLIDSMPFWQSLGSDYLRAHGVTPPANLREVIGPMTISGAAAYFAALGITDTVEQIVNECNSMMRRAYSSVIPPRKGVEGYLAALRARGVRCCVATATDTKLAALCLERLGLLRYFEFIESCEQLGIGKDRPDIYLIAARKLGCTDPADAAVFEDAPYAARTAKQAGFYTVGVFDPAAETPPEELLATADAYITDYTEATALLPQEGLS